MKILPQLCLRTGKSALSFGSHPDLYVVWTPDPNRIHLGGSVRSLSARVVVCFSIGNFLPSSDDPVAVRMVSDKSMRLASLDDGMVDAEGSGYLGVVSGYLGSGDAEGSGYLGVVSLVAVFAGAAATTVVSLATFVAVYVYIEAVRELV